MDEDTSEDTYVLLQDLDAAVRDEQHNHLLVRMLLARAAKKIREQRREIIGI